MSSRKVQREQQVHRRSITFLRLNHDGTYLGRKIRRSRQEAGPVQDRAALSDHRGSQRERARPATRSSSARVSNTYSGLQLKFSVLSAWMKHPRRPPKGGLPCSAATGCLPSRCFTNFLPKNIMSFVSRSSICPNSLRKLNRNRASNSDSVCLNHSPSPITLQMHQVTTKGVAFDRIPGLVRSNS